MIENADTEEKARRPKSLGDGSIFCARTGVPARMVVNDHERSRCVANGLAEHLPRMDQACGQGSNRDFFGGDQTVTSIEQQDMESLPLEIAQAATKVTLNVGRAADRLATFEGFINESSRELDRCTQTRRFRRTKPWHRFERATTGLRQPSESAKPIDCRTPDRPGILGAISSSQHQRDELSIGESAHALLLQSLARSIRQLHWTPRCRW
jgi:hypothetical protein